MENHTYYFLGSNYMRFNRKENKVDKSVPISVGWHGLPPLFQAGIDAVVNWKKYGKLYFFRQNMYVSYDTKRDHADAGYPLQIKEGWPRFEELHFDTNIDAAINWDGNKAYFFKGDKFLEYGIDNDVVKDPEFIKDKWIGFDKAGFVDRIDAVVDWDDGNFYFFKDDKYLRFNVAQNKVADTNPPYPLDTQTYWPGLNVSGVVAGLGGAIDLSISGIWLDGFQRKPVTPDGGEFVRGFPPRGVLHTTETATLPGIGGYGPRGDSYPHLAIDGAGTRYQFISLHRAARALGDSGAITNKAHAIQIEILGKAAESPKWSSAKLTETANVMRLVESRTGVPRRSGLQFLDEQGVGRNPKNRMDAGQWASFSGWCGHQHVPANTGRSDPGAIVIASLLGP
jgi:hypothetical protein